MKKQQHQQHHPSNVAHILNFFLLFNYTDYVYFVNSFAKFKNPEIVVYLIYTIMSLHLFYSYKLLLLYYDTVYQIFLTC